jgi:hypothetical protein
LTIDFYLIARIKHTLSEHFVLWKRPLSSQNKIMS